MSQPPPVIPEQPMPYVPPQQPKTSGWAVASLICGILGCLPLFITGLLAIVFGIIGLGKSRQPNIRGRGMALAGLILGILSLLWSAGVVGSSYWLYRVAQTNVIQPADRTISGLFNSLYNSDLQTAQSYATSELTQPDLSTLARQVQSYGKFKDFTLRGLDVKPGSTSNSATFTLRGIAVFDGATKNVTITMTGDPKTGTGYKISQMTFEP